MLVYGRVFVFVQVSSRTLHMVDVAIYCWSLLLVYSWRVFFTWEVILIGVQNLEKRVANFLCGSLAEV